MARNTKASKPKTKKKTLANPKLVVSSMKQDAIIRARKKQMKKK